MLIPLVVPLLLHFTTPALAGSAVKGVHPSRVDIYTPSGSGTWKCLDGSKEIKWSAVNDDYCDCADGSDEPGTSACANGSFYCTNTGHIGTSIRSTRVGDGLCEPECCDGSDEAPGVCPDDCEAIGKKYREETAAANKTRKTGAKIRSVYIAFAKKEKKRAEDAIVELKKELEIKTAEEQRALERLQQLETIDAASLEHKKNSPLFHALEEHKSAISTLHARSKDLASRISTLESLLDDLEKGYNPNYVDMAVISTVKAWKAMKGVSEEEDKEGVTEGTETPIQAATYDAETVEEEEPELWTDADVRRVERKDSMSLLLDHEKHIVGGIKDDATSILFTIEEYLPDTFLPTYEYAKEYLLDVLATFGVLPKGADNSAELDRAKSAHQEAQTALKSAESTLHDQEVALSKLFAVDGFGKEGEWKKLEGTCLEKNTGEYTYSVCLFGSATQKSNRDGATNNLGKYSSWHPTAEQGTAEYYAKQMYTRGARCWNGPERSVTLDLTCGTENALLGVSEPEKCEYRFVGTSPALCLPLEEDSVSRDEL